MVDDSLDLDPHLVDQLAAWQLGRGGTQLVSGLVAVCRQLVSAGGELGDARGADVGGHGAGLKCVQVAVEGGDGLAQLCLGACVFGFETRAFVADLGVHLTNAILEEFDAREGFEKVGAHCCFQVVGGNALA